MTDIRSGWRIVSARSTDREEKQNSAHISSTQRKALLVAAGEQEDLRPFFAPRERGRALGFSAIPMSQNGHVLGHDYEFALNFSSGSADLIVVICISYWQFYWCRSARLVQGKQRPKAPAQLAAVVEIRDTKTCGTHRVRWTFLVDFEYRPTMQYPYPAEFPRKARALVRGESISAARNFEEAKQAAHDRSDIEKLLRNYILRVFIEFVREARHLGRQGLWTVDQLESESREFLRQCTIEAWHEKGYDRSGSRLRDVVSHWDGSILPEIQRAFERSPEWQEFQSILLEVADAQASRQEDESQREANASEPAPTVKQQIDWENIKILFLSDERVQVGDDTQPQTYNYGEMGFIDKRSGRPNQAWGILRALAHAGGVIPNSARDSKQFIHRHVETD